MIPKIIHYCWFGKREKPASFYEYLETWKAKLPDYEIKEWSEDNFDIRCCKYVEQAYQAQKFAFVSDYARLYVLSKEGGIYFDTDVEVIKSFDSLLNNDFFMGYESGHVLGTSVIGSVKNFWLIDKMLAYYDSISFVSETGVKNYTPNTLIISNILKNSNVILDGKFKQEKGITLYEFDYFSPFNSLTSKFVESENTYSIHRFTGSWFPQYFIIERKFWQFLGIRNMKLCLRFVNLIKHGSIRGRLMD